ncbi:MAG: hypothetical protein WBC83_03375 [Minisyncoccia bacterium]
MLNTNKDMIGVKDTAGDPNENITTSNEVNREGVCASCSEQLPVGTVAYICNACALGFENEFKKVSTNNEFEDNYDEPVEELADDDSELYDLKIEEWAEDDEVLKQNLESEELEDLQG